MNTDAHDLNAPSSSADNSDGYSRRKFAKAGAAALAAGTLGTGAGTTGPLLSPDHSSSAAQTAEGNPESDAEPFKILSVLRRKDGLSREAFYDHWHNEHAPLVAAIPGVVKYHQYVPSQRSIAREDASGGDAPPVDGMAETWFASEKAFEEAQGTSEFQAVAEDEPRFLNSGSQGNLAVVVERTVVVVSEP